MQHLNIELQTREIVTKVAGGRMVLPQFQRPFVWDPNAVLELVDSLVHGWPIGTLLLLRGPQPFAVRGITGGPDVDLSGPSSSNVEYYILDGQQRITSLYHVVTDTGGTQYLVNLADDLQEEQSPLSWRKRTSAPLEPMTFLLSSVLDDDHFHVALSELSESQRRAARKNRQSRLGYLLDPSLRIPAILLHQEIDLEALTRIFETLNRTGTPLDAFDLMVALLYPQDFHLGEEYKEAKRKLPVLGEFDTPGLELLKYIALLQRHRELTSPSYLRPPEKRVRGVRQRDVLNTPSAFVVSNWPAAIAAYASALEWAQKFGGVRDSESVPSRAMLLTLTFALQAGVDTRTLREWYWASLGLQSYAQGANTQVTTDVDRLLSRSFMPGAWLEGFRAGLLDEARRNRVLRMGLRGLAEVGAVPDAFTGQPIEGSVRDLSVLRLARGEVSAPGEDPLADRVLVARSHVARLRRLAATTGNLLPHLDEAALAKQGVTLASMGDDLDSFRARRCDFLTELVARSVNDDLLA